MNGSDVKMMNTFTVKEEPLTPAEVKDKKEKEIRYYRHKLQKGLVSRDTKPSEEEIKSMYHCLSQLETTYPDLEDSIISATKIHKVLKAIIRLNFIPKNEEFQFKKRCYDLLRKWNQIDPSAAAPEEISNLELFSSLTI